MSSRLLKDAFSVLIAKLTYLFNRCIDLGDIPQSWCHSTISLIPKTKSKSNKPKDWRPITQIPLPGKLFEKIIHEQVYTYFNSNNILSSQQYGFRTGMSTSLAIFDVLKLLYSNWNDKLFTGCIFVDYSRAFETIDHEILLSNRTQSTTVNNYTSENSNVTYGTAQGSVLGPLIYIIYVNDVLKKKKEETNIIMYADDMLIISQHADLDVMSSMLQRSLDSIVRWCNHNKLTVNKDKTKCMVISKKKNIALTPFKIENRLLCKVTHYEYLGVILDQDLKMIPQVDSMYKKANSKLGILSKIRRFITEKTAVRVYKTMIRPYLEYVDFIIESSTKEKVLKVDALQHKALRRIEYCRTPEEKETYEVLERKFKIEKLEIRRKRSLLRLMYISSKDSTNIKMITHNKNLRSTKKVKMKEDFSGLTKLHQSPYYRGRPVYRGGGWGGVPPPHKEAA